jgi:hypothetical protein
LGSQKISKNPRDGMYLANDFTICQREGEMAVKTCQCGSQYFYVSNLEKKKIEVTCLVCKSFYGALIPVLEIGHEGRWVMVSHN